MLTVVLDLDDTMVPSGPTQLNIVAEANGWMVDDLPYTRRPQDLPMDAALPYLHTQFREANYDWLAYSGMTAPELQSAFLKYQLLERVSFHSDASRANWTDFIRKLNKRYRVVICTARGWHPDAYAITARMLGDDIMDNVHLIVVPHDKVSKVERLSQQGYQVDCMMDDNPRELRAAWAHGVPMVIRHDHLCAPPPAPLDGENSDRPFAEPLRFHFLHEGPSRSDQELIQRNLYLVERTVRRGASQ